MILFQLIHNFFHKTNKSTHQVDDEKLITTLEFQKDTHYEASSQKGPRDG